MKLSRKRNKGGGKKVQLFVAISYGKGVMCEEYTRRPPSGIREGMNWLFFVRKFVKMKKNRS